MTQLLNDPTRHAFKGRLAEDGFQLGTFVQIPSPELVELHGLAGFDFVILDMEHGAYGFDELRNLIRAANVRAVSPIVRVAEATRGLISRVMDLGAAGVMVPQIETPLDLKTVVGAVKYPPLGERGYCSGVRAAGYLGEPGFTAYANQQTAVIPLIENPRAVENLDSLLAVPGVDAVMIGPGDLSSAMGRPGDWLSPPVSTVLDDLVSQIVSRGLPVGMHIKEPAHAEPWLGKGVKFFTYGMDAQLILKHLATIRNSIDIATQR